MTSIMSIDDTALEGDTSEQQRESSATAATAATASAASGNIQIGHVEEIDDDGFNSQYSESEYGEDNENFSDGEVMLGELKRNQSIEHGKISSSTQCEHS